MFYPVANVLAPIPSVIFTPFLVILMPTYRWAAVMVILLGVFWPQFLNMILRVSSLPEAIVENARVLKVGNITMITKVILPFIVPDLLKGMRVSLTTGFLMLMYAESFGTKSGLGYFISNANIFANYSNILAGIIVCGIVVTVLNYGTAWLQKKLTTWR
jgi:NitT/TauT family transport system permease protein